MRISEIFQLGYDRDGRDHHDHHYKHYRRHYYGRRRRYRRRYDDGLVLLRINL